MGINLTLPSHTPQLLMTQNSSKKLATLEGSLLNGFVFLLMSDH